MRYCRHVRWTFDQGGSGRVRALRARNDPYVWARGFKSGDIPNFWWNEHGDWVVEQVMAHFDAADGYVFGDLAGLDLLARDVWKQFRPDPVRPSMTRF
jgi:hypothetical protein